MKRISSINFYEISDIVKKTGIPVSTVKFKIKQLITSGKINVEPPGTGKPYYFVLDQFNFICSNIVKTPRGWTKGRKRL